MPLTPSLSASTLRKQMPATGVANCLNWRTESELYRFCDDAKATSPACIAISMRTNEQTLDRTKFHHITNEGHGLKHVLKVVRPDPTGRPGLL